MMRNMCKSKIHRVTLTQADINYQGSITIDSELMKAADLIPYEQVQVVNINTGGRLETYVITGEAKSGVIGLNGAAARLGAIGDLLIIMSYGVFTDEEAHALKPRIVFVDGNNRITKISRETEPI